MGDSSSEPTQQTDAGTLFSVGSGATTRERRDAQPTAPAKLAAPPDTPAALTPATATLATFGTAAPPVIPKGRVTTVVDKHRYTLKKEHARGGMGRILLALDNSMGRDVALKELLPKGAGTSKSGSPFTPSPQADVAVERFLREARITGRLEHPNIVPVYEIGERPDGGVYYTMKFVRGRSLASRIKAIGEDESLDGRAKLAERLKLLDAFVDVCNAIAYAHSHKVIHRDLKPDNVMLGDFGETLVLDWGLAKVDGEADVSATTGSTTGETRGGESSGSALTMDGAIMGTPAYMPPEQARGDIAQVDDQSDVYSLGAILYEILGGKPPYQGGGSAHAVLARVLADPPKPVTELAPETPRELVAVLEHAMARDKSERMASARELAAEVQAFRDGRTLSVYDYSAFELLKRFVKRNKAAVGLGAAALVVLAGVIGTFAYLGHRERQAQIAERQGDIAQQRETIAALKPADTANAAKSRMARRNDEDLSPSEKADNGAALSALLEVISAQERLLELLTAPVAGGAPEFVGQAELEAAKAELAAAQSLAARLAAVNEDFALADFIVSGAALEDVAKATERAGIEKARGARLQRHAIAIGAALDDVRKDLSRKERPPSAPMFDEYVAKLSGYREKQTVDLLAAALEPFIVKARGAPIPSAPPLPLGEGQGEGSASEGAVARAPTAEEAKAVQWTQSERFEMTLICHVLGNLELPQYTIEPLGRFMAVVWDDTLATECGLALCATQDARAHPVLITARDRLGINGSAWDRISRRFARVPDPNENVEPTDAKGFNNRGVMRQDKGDLDGAIADFTRALELDAKATGAFSNRGRARRAKGDIDGAIADYTRAIELDAKYVAAFNNRGNALQDKRDFDGAIADFTRAIELDPKNSELFNNRGIAFRGKGDLDGAIADYSRAIELDPKENSAFNNRGLARRKKGDLDGAIDDYTRAIEIDPKEDAAFINRGNARSKKGDLDGAIADYTRAIELDPKGVNIFLNRGMAYQAAGDFNNAILDFTNLLKNKPNDPQADAIQKTISDLKAKLAAQSNPEERKDEK